MFLYSNGWHQVPELLKKFDEHPMAECHKFGVIYQKFGQTSEEELFGNTDHPDSLDEFLDMLGTKVELKGFEGYVIHGEKKKLLPGFCECESPVVYTENIKKEILFMLSVTAYSYCLH